MKTKHLIILGILTVVVVAYGISIVPNVRRKADLERTFTALKSLSHNRIENAAQAFARDRKTNSVVHGSVSFRELVSGGYLNAEDIQGLQDRDVNVALTPDEANSNGIWIHVHLDKGGRTSLKQSSLVTELKAGGDPVKAGEPPCGP